jgi:hypothetical protein
LPFKASSGGKSVWETLEYLPIVLLITIIATLTQLSEWQLEHRRPKTSE